MLVSIGIGNGDFADFSAAWYPKVGANICLAMFLNVFTPNMLTWLRLSCLDHCRRVKTRRTAVTQAQLNEGYSGRVFKLEYRYPTVLNVVFVTMLYSSGMPILYPVAAVTCTVMYWTDKTALLRLYNRPPMYRASLASITLKVLPVALALHLMFAVWMFGSPSVLESHELFSGALSGIDDSDMYSDLLLNIGEANQTDTLAATGGDGQPLGDVSFSARLSRLNAFLPFFALVLLVAYAVLKLVVWWWVHTVVKTLLRLVTCGHCTTPRQSKHKRKHLPGFTEPHVCYAGLVPEDASLTPVERKLGWVLEDNFDGSTLRYKVWTEDGVTGGQRHEKGQKKATWEVIRDSALHTYDISANPAYEGAFAKRRDSVGLDTVAGSL